MLSVPTQMIPSGMKAVHVGKPFLSVAIEELKALGAKRAFVLANRSSTKFIEGDGKLLDELKKMGALAAPLCTSIGMGGGETVCCYLQFDIVPNEYEFTSLYSIALSGASRSM